MSFLLRRPLPSIPSLSSSSSSSTSARTLSSTPSHRLAKITIVGRLAADPEEVPTSSGNPMIRYALGTSSGPRDNRHTSWWKVACFAPNQGLRDIMMGLGKGSLLYVEGEASMRKFTNSENNQQQALSIVQRAIDILEKKPPNSSEESESSNESESSE